MSTTTNNNDPAHYIVSSRGQILEISKSQLFDYLESESFDPWIFDTPSLEEAEAMVEENRRSTELYENPDR